MAAPERDWVVFSVFVAFVGVGICVGTDLFDYIWILLRIVFVLGIIIVLCLRGLYMLKKMRKKISNENNHSQSPEKYNVKEKLVRKEEQENYKYQSSQYRENVLKPKAEAKLKQAEEEYYRFLGPAWKGHGEKLGAEGEISSVKNGTGRDAAEARKLPEHVTKKVEPKVEEKQKETKVITIPDEPPAGSPHSVTISLRSHLGKIHKRRFLWHEKIQVLLDYITKLGYHQNLYTIVTTYPRECLDSHTDKSLEEIGLTRDTVLNVEEREEFRKFSNNGD